MDMKTNHKTAKNRWADPGLLVPTAAYERETRRRQRVTTTGRRRLFRHRYLLFARQRTRTTTEGPTPRRGHRDEQLTTRTPMNIITPKALRVGHKHLDGGTRAGIVAAPCGADE